MNKAANILGTNCVQVPLSTCPAFLPRIHPPAVLQFAHKLSTAEYRVFAASAAVIHVNRDDHHHNYQGK
jgi:hypothetical protein